MSSGRVPTGALKVRVIRGRNLAMRDIRGSDPYVVLSTKNKQVKTRVIKKNLNPEWNEDLTLYVTDSADPIRLEVFDKDRITHDDPMGRVNIDIRALVEAATAAAGGGHSAGDGVIRVVHPESNGPLVTESKIQRRHGRVVQDMVLRLQDVECGEVELQLEWIGTGRASR